MKINYSQYPILPNSLNGTSKNLHSQVNTVRLPPQYSNARFGPYFASYQPCVTPAKDPNILDVNDASDLKKIHALLLDPWVRVDV
jgi:hypothetical protein